MIQNVLLAVLYAVVAIAVWRTGVRFPALFIYCAVSVVYQFAAIYLDAVGGMMMLGLLIVAALESAWWAVSKQIPGRAQLIAMLFFIWGAVATMLYGGKSFYLSSRTVFCGAAFCMLLALTLIDISKEHRLDCDPLSRINLRLMCLWMGSRAISAATYDLYHDADTWLLARWLYAAYLVPVAIAYFWSFERSQEVG